MQPVLKNLIEISSLPLIPIESRFAADASGFSTSVYDRWHDHKWGQKKAHAKYMKAHIVCGVITNIVTAVEVTDADSHDSPYLASLMEATARHFNMREVSADKGYLSRGNLHLIQEYGAEPLIPFKSNSKAEHSDGPDSLWTRCYLYYTLHKEEFKPRYHKRSNVETTFSMIKAKFGADLASKKEEALVNEVLVKVLCHNICVLVQSFYKLGVTSDFKLTDDMPVSPGDSAILRTGLTGFVLLPRPWPMRPPSPANSSFPSDQPDQPPWRESSHPGRMVPVEIYFATIFTPFHGFI